MRGAQRVVIVDALQCGAPPGTVYRLPGEELDDLPPLQGLHPTRSGGTMPSHSPGGLGEACLSDITVFLIEAADVALGADLSEPVEKAMEEVIALVERDFFAPLRPQVGAEARVEFTADGYLRLDAALAASRFLRCGGGGGARRRPVADPVARAAQRGLLLKQRTPAGDRATLVREVLADRIPEGVREAFWDDANKALRIPLDRH
jgi:hypothetical protein